VHDLPLKIRKIDDISVDETDGSDTSRSEIQTSWRPQTTCTNQEDLRSLELELALATHILKNNVPAVALNF
jgi:hypothetical protein